MSGERRLRPLTLASLRRWLLRAAAGAPDLLTARLLGRLERLLAVPASVEVVLTVPAIPGEGRADRLAIEEQR
jgi:hypothetical protein